MQVSVIYQKYPKFNEMFVKITLLRSITKNLTRVCNAVYFRLCIDLMHITPPVTAEGSLVTARPIPYVHQTSSVLRRSPLELLSIAGIIYYTCSLVINIQCIRHKNAFNKLV